MPEKPKRARASRDGALSNDLDMEYDSGLDADDDQDDLAESGVWTSGALLDDGAAGGFARSSDTNPLKADRRRPASWLGKSQGAHVTAYGLIRRALARIFSDINQGDNATSEEWFRAKRKQVFQFVDKLLVLESNVELRRSFKRNVGQLLRQYSKQRSRITGLTEAERYFLRPSTPEQDERNTKHKIMQTLKYLAQKSRERPKPYSMGDMAVKLSKVFSRRLITGDRHGNVGNIARRLVPEVGAIFKSGAAKDPEAIYQILKSARMDDGSIRQSLFNQHRVKNAKLLESTMRDMTNEILRFYNKMPQVSFHHTAESKARRKGKQYESSALNALDRGADRVTDAGLVKVMDGLLDYKQVGGKTLEIAAAARLEGKRGHRSNDVGLLVELVAKHLYLFFSCYPDAGKKYGFNIYDLAGSRDLSKLETRVLNPFLDQFIAKDWSQVVSDSTQNQLVAGAGSVITSIKKRFKEFVDKSFIQPRFEERVEDESDLEDEEGDLAELASGLKPRFLKLVVSGSGRGAVAANPCAGFDREVAQGLKSLVSTHPEEELLSARDRQMEEMRQAMLALKAQNAQLMQENRQLMQENSQLKQRSVRADHPGRGVDRPESSARASRAGIFSGQKRRSVEQDVSPKPR